MEEDIIIYDETYVDNSLQPYITAYRFLKGVGVMIGNILYKSPHLTELQQGIDILSNIPDEVQMLDPAQLRQAIACFDKTDITDKLYVQCLSWQKKACCYAILGKWEESYKMIDKIDNIQITWDTVNKDCINECKANLPTLRLHIDLAKIGEELERTKTELAKKGEELERTKTELTKIRKENNNDTVKLRIPMTVYIICTLLVAITVLVCYIIFK